MIYKVLDLEGKPCRGGTGSWNLASGKRPGKWMPTLDDIQPCRRGYHVCDGTRDLVMWLGPVIWEAEIRGATIRDDDKTVAAQARLLRRVDAWNERTARLFAVDCAEDVLPIYERAYPDDDRPRLAIAAARAYANGECDRVTWDAARDAAHAAAHAAARDAARDAAWAVAWAVARDAARAAAHAAARAAARDAAWAVAWAVARVAAWDRHAERLARYLERTSL